tara:strand:+ start:64 stop:246 length:183 start_codon:yes stop_codon:yes gene_type:complete
MVSFARTTAKSWNSRLWPLTVQPVNNVKVKLDKSKEIIKKQHEQNKYFLATIKNGGIWFS